MFIQAENFQKLKLVRWKDGWTEKWEALEPCTKPLRSKVGTHRKLYWSFGRTWRVRRLNSRCSRHRIAGVVSVTEFCPFPRALLWRPFFSCTIVGNLDGCEPCALQGRKKKIHLCCDNLKLLRKPIFMCHSQSMNIILRPSPHAFTKSFQTHL